MHAWDLNSYCDMETGNAHLDGSKSYNPMKRLKRTRRTINLDSLERNKDSKRPKNLPLTQNKPLKYGMVGLVLCIMGILIRSNLIT